MKRAAVLKGPSRPAGGACQASRARPRRSGFHPARWSPASAAWGSTSTRSVGAFAREETIRARGGGGRQDRASGAASRPRARRARQARAPFSPGLGDQRIWLRRASAMAEAPTRSTRAGAGEPRWARGARPRRRPLCRRAPGRGISHRGHEQCHRDEHLDGAFDVAEPLAPRRGTATPAPEHRSSGRGSKSAERRRNATPPKKTEAPPTQADVPKPAPRRWSPAERRAHRRLYPARLIRDTGRVAALTELIRMSLVPHPCRHSAPSRPSASRSPRRQACRGPFAPCRSRRPSHGCAPPTATPQARRLSSHACRLLPSAFVSSTRAFSRLRAHHRVLALDRPQRGDPAEPLASASAHRPVSQHPCQPGIRRRCSRGEGCCASCLADRPCP